MIYIVDGFPDIYVTDEFELRKFMHHMFKNSGKDIQIENINFPHVGCQDGWITFKFIDEEGTSKQWWSAVRKFRKVKLFDERTRF